jgi:uncharacterized protein YbaR (Trm112 family)
VNLAAQLLEWIVCPRCKQPLLYFPRGEADEREDDAFLLCPAERLRFRIEAGLPRLVVEEAVALAAPEVARLVERAHRLGLVAR